MLQIWQHDEPCCEQSLAAGRRLLAASSC